MTPRYWFKARKHGIGWTPSTWHGWSVLVLYLAVLVYSFFQIDGVSHSVSDTLINFFFRAVTFTALLTVITYLTGEPTRWPTEEEKEHHKSSQ